MVLRAAAPGQYSASDAEVTIDWSKIIEDGVRAYDNQVVGQTISPWLLGGLALMMFASK